MNENNIFRFILTLLVGVVLVSCSNDGDDTGTVAASCSVAAPEALRTCINGVNSTTSTCYEDGNQACDESAFASALATLKTTVERSCAAGDISGLSVKALVGRLDNSCQSQSDSIAWRTYGGPQGAVWSDANASDKDCLLAAHATVSSFFDASLAAVNECLANDDCDAEAVTEQQRLAASEAADTVVQSCGMLENLIAVNAQTYIERAENQIDCTLATSHEDTAPFSPSCGPSYAEPVPPRGIWTQIILDGDKWGSMCGDGTDYAIQVRLAPEGQPLDRVMVALQGGGVCILSQCAGRFESNPGLFNAQDDEPLGNLSLIHI